MTICARYRPLLAGILCLLLTAGCEQHDPERGPMATDPWIGWRRPVLACWQDIWFWRTPETARWS